MPRLDPFRALHPDLDPYATAGVRSAIRIPPADPLLLSYRSGFWGIVQRSPGEVARTAADSS